MRAAVTPEPNGLIGIESAEEPKPRSGEVLVRVYASSVNRLDRAVYEGKGLGRAATFPLIQGIDAAGVIEAGSGSTPTGSRVAVKPTIACRRCRSCRAGRSSDCENARIFGVQRQGGFAELLAVPRTNLVRLPDSLSYAEGAAAAHTYPVVLRMIRRAGDLAPEPTVVVTGAGGSLGTAAVQLSVALGSRVVAIASSRAKLDVAESLGAAILVDSTEAADPAEAVRDAAGSEGADLVIETTGVAGMIRSGYESLAKGGKLVLVAGPSGMTLDLDVGELYQTRRSVIGSAGSNDRDFSDVYRLLEEHAIHPVIADTYPLNRTQEAMDAVIERGRVGKIVIDVGGAS